MSSGPVRTERDGAVTTVLLCRPQRRNAVDGATARALADAFREFGADSRANVAVLHGEGGTFCAGADLHAAGAEAANRVSALGDAPMGPTRMRLSKPVIAAVAGHAWRAASSSRCGATCAWPTRPRCSGSLAAAGAYP